MSSDKKYKLTDYTSCTGCGSKMSLGDLSQMVDQVCSSSDARLLVGAETFDDAGVFALDENRALIQTLDFFPPVVDHPRWYGRIAAANAISDVYAMGGRPLVVMNIAGFPKESDAELIGEILGGAAEKVKEAGAVIAGGHTIRTGIEMLFGLSVTGEVHPSRVTANTNAQVGDLLYLTKPLGMGSATFAAKQDKLAEPEVEAMQVQLATLNNKACEAMIAVGTKCATDVTGYGILGHARNIARASRVTLRFESSKLPFFPPSIELGKKGAISSAATRNRESFSTVVSVGSSVPKHIADLAFDAETSGGLLICVPKDKASLLEGQFSSRKVPGILVGEVIAKGSHLVELV